MTAGKLLNEKERAGIGFELLILVLGIVLALMLTFHLSEVDKTSMLPNIEPKDVAVHVEKKVKRGDVVIAMSASSGRVIKRAVGMPGDTLEFRRSTEDSSIAVIYINGALYPEEYILEGMRAEKFNSYAFAKLNIPIELGAGEYFLLGDNRNISLDSRDTGVALVKEIEGVVVTVFDKDSFFSKLVKFLYKPERTEGLAG